MKIYPEIKNIAGKNEAVKRLGQKLSEKLGHDDLIWETACFVTGCKERGGHLYQNGKQLDNAGLVDNEYYCDEYPGYCEDDGYHGTLYFKTNTPGQFVAVLFDM